MKVSKKWYVVGDYAVSDVNSDEENSLTYGGCGCCGGGPKSAIEDEPVARLMAAAPELLDALRRNVTAFDYDAHQLLKSLEDIELTEE